MKNKIPNFKSEKEEFEFWTNNDTTDFIDWEKAKNVKFSNLKPSTKTISIRLPEALIEYIKVLANKIDVPYQSLIKIMLSKEVFMYKNK